MLKSTILLGFLLLTFIPFASAEIYKWVDENGNVHYGDKPGQNDSSKVEIDTDPDTVKSEPGMAERLEKQQRMLQIYEEERLEKEQKRTQAEQKRQETRKKCSQLKDYQRNLKQATRLYVLDDYGNRKYLNESTHKKEIQSIEEQLQKYCK